MIEFYIKNTDEVINEFHQKAVRLIDSLKRGLVRGVELFSGWFIRTYLSLPKPADWKTAPHPGEGLYVQTGTLRNSWLVRSKGMAVSDFAVQMSTSSAYGVYHQKYLDIAPKIPKRIDLYGSFAVEGLAFINREINKKL